MKYKTEKYGSYITFNNSEKNNFEAFCLLLYQAKATLEAIPNHENKKVLEVRVFTTGDSIKWEATVREEASKNENN